MNLIPDKPGSTPSYWCTWGIQNFSLTAQQFPNFAGWNAPVNNLSESLLFDSPGWATDLFKPVQKDLFIMFDVGWDLPPGINIDAGRWQLGSLELAEARFPSCAGSPAERQRKLNLLVQSAGWRGAGLWVGAQMPGDSRAGHLLPDDLLEPYYRERAHWAAEAGIPYWKVDVGARTGSTAYHHLLSKIAREEAPDLIIEHGPNCGPLNDVAVPWETSETRGDGRFASWKKIYERALAQLPFSDVLRTYDVTGQLSIATTLDRVAQLLLDGCQGPAMELNARGILNCEDEPYLGAALGCAIGIMRHPWFIKRPGEDYDPTRVAHKIDAVVRAVRWQRIAPAFGVKAAPVKLDPQLLTDIWTFLQGETWADFVWGKTIQQSAPARVSRGMELAEVQPGADGERPFVVASRHPNGAVAVAALPRTMPGKEIFLPLANVSLRMEDPIQPLGVFGRFQSLRIQFRQPLEDMRIFAQDLAGETAEDITERVRVKGNELIISKELFDAIRLSAATPGDESDPAFVLKMFP